MTPGANATCTTGLNSRLVCLGIQLRLAEVSAPPEMPSLKERQASIVSGLTAVSSDLQQISRGIHPAILSTGDPVNRRSCQQGAGFSVEDAGAPLSSVGEP
jgi:hypothetical protein